MTKIQSCNPLLGKLLLLLLLLVQQQQQADPRPLWIRQNLRPRVLRRQQQHPRCHDLAIWPLQHGT